MRAARLRGALATAGAAVIGAGLAFGVPAGAAVAVQSESPPTKPVVIRKNAELQARGAGVTVRVAITCAPYSYAQGRVNISQRVPGGVAHGYADIPGNRNLCTGSPVVLRLPMNAQDHAFRVGPAFVTASVTICYFDCVTTQAQREVRIVDDN